MNWSSPINADPAFASKVPVGPIAYRARVVEADGVTPRAVQRFWKPDPEGTMVIGETENGQARFAELTKAMRGRVHGRSSSTGWHYYWWYGYGHFTPDHIVYEWIELNPTIQAFVQQLGRPVAPGAVTEAAELLLIYHYRRRFGDLPPCNQRNPNYNSVAKWMRAELGITPRYDTNARWNVPLLDLPGLPALSWAQAQASTGDVIGED